MNKAMIVLLLSLFALRLCAQTMQKNDALKFDADYYMMEKDFNKALTTYLNILKSEPENADVKYRIGICYLNSEEQKNKAISYLEEAVQKISEDYNPSSFKETDAPIDAVFLLGSAYRIDNRIDEAIAAYTRYKSYLGPKDEYNLNVVNQYLRHCELARTMKEKPANLTLTNLGKPVNSEAPNFNAVFSGDGKSLFYTSPARQGYDIFTSQLKDTVWSVPRNMTSVLGTGKYMTTADLSEDGQTLLLTLDDPMNADIYVSHLVKGKWSKAESIGKEINSKYNETHASLSNDGNTLFFASDRKGGQGDLDIYKSVKDEKGNWSKPENLGPVINTPFNENTPFLAEKGDRLYFSSEGHEGMGGYDIFYYNFSNPSEGVVNVGYPLNTTDNDLFFVPTGEGTTGYYAFRGEDSYGARDIYMIHILPPMPEPELAIANPVIAEPIDSSSYSRSITDSLAAEPEIAAIPSTPEITGEDSLSVSPPVEEPPVAAILPDQPQINEPAPDQTIVNSETQEISVATPNENLTGATSFKVQIMALKHQVDLSRFSGLNDVILTWSGDAWFRYTVGNTTSLSDAQKLLSELVLKGYKDAFIRGYVVDPKYTVQFMAVPGPVVNLKPFEDLSEIIVTKGKDNFCRYASGEYATKDAAMSYLERIKAMGYKTAFVAKVNY